MPEQDSRKSWSPTDEAAYIAATKPDDEPPAPSAAEMRASRYATIRKHLGQATERGTLTNETYLLAQIALVACDLLDEVGSLADEVRQLNATNLELIIHRSVK